MAKNGERSAGASGDRGGQPSPPGSSCATDWTLVAFGPYCLEPVGAHPHWLALRPSTTRPDLAGRAVRPLSVASPCSRAVGLIVSIRLPPHNGRDAGCQLMRSGPPKLRVVCDRAIELFDISVTRVAVQRDPFARPSIASRGLGLVDQPVAYRARVGLPGDLERDHGERLEQLDRLVGPARLEPAFWRWASWRSGPSQIRTAPAAARHRVRRARPALRRRAVSPG